jgi:uncharacterized membrane protein
MTYGHPYGWLVLVAIVILAAYVRHFFNLRHRRRTVWAIPITAAFGAFVLALAIAPERPVRSSAPVGFREIQAIVDRRCAGCHAEHPTQAGFVVAPKDLKLDTPERILVSAPKIYEQAVATKAMPIGNLTGMTDEERARIAAWIEAGAAR